MENTRSRSWTITLVFILLVSTLPLFTQRPIPPFTLTAPFDFSNETYKAGGVSPKGIIGRRTGNDGLSVPEKSGDLAYANIRVLITVPAYDQSGNPLFWYPLGELRNTGFTQDKAGAVARQIATLYPLYVFPNPRMKTPNSFTGVRQAPMIDNTWATYGDTAQNPLGLRQILNVTYTAKALGKEGFAMMGYFGKKNGFASDDTPLIKSLEDLQILQKNAMVHVRAPGVYDPTPEADWDLYNDSVQYAIVPVIKTTKGFIRPDAFLWMATKDGTSLPSEQIFVLHFGCLQKTGDWCQ